jgi:hypothetical protein
MLAITMALGAVVVAAVVAEVILRASIGTLG